MNKDTQHMTDQNQYAARESLERSTVNDILEYRSANQPEKTYVLYGHEDRAVSYREMNEGANAIANGLLGLLDGRTQEKVSVMMGGQLPILFAFHGILKAGSIYTPIHRDYKGDNLRYQLNDSLPEVLIVDDRYVERLNAVRPGLERLPHVVIRETTDRGVPLDDEFDRTQLEDLRARETADPGAELAWDDIATVIYTSGTTGRPKGVLHSHRQVLVLYGDLKSTFIAPDDVVHNNLPLFHVGGLYGNVVATLVAGATVVCWDKFSTSEFWDRVERYEASRAVIFSSMITWLDNQPETDTDHHNTLNKVTFVPLVEGYEEIAERFGFDIVDTYYGQTEIGLSIAGAVRAATGEDATPDTYTRGRDPNEVVERAQAKGIPVVDTVPEPNWAGKPAAPVDVTLVDDRDEEVPVGETGELVARPEAPAMIFMGYNDAPGETAGAWRNLWHHTGDALKRDEEGYYYFIDRINDVIRRAGENISTTQIEKPLMNHDGIDEVAAFSVPAAEGAEDEVAIAVEPEQGTDLTTQEVQSIAGEVLPRFMIPEYVLILDELPTTETAKIEKYKLRDQVLEREGLDPE